MKESYEIIIKLMNSFIYNKAFSIDKKTPWKEVLYYSRINSISGIIGHVLNTYYSNDAFLQDSILTHFTKYAIRDFGIMALKYDQRLYISSEFSRYSIDHVVFKGFVLRDYYPVKELRVFGDMDILIKPEDRQKSDKVMKSLAFETSNNWEPTYSYKKSLSYVEVHTNLLDTDISDKYKVKAFFDNNTNNNLIKKSNHVYEFNKEFHLVFLITHIAKHCSTSGAGIKMFLDLALMIHNEPHLKWNRIETYLKEMRMWHFSSFVFSFLSKYFHIEIPITTDVILIDELELFAEYIFEAGTFGQYKRDSGSVQLLKSNTSKYKTIIQRFFPSARTIEKRYTYLVKYPFLLPVAWVHRGVLNVTKVKRFLQKNKQVLKADYEETERLKNIQTMIGL